MEGRDGQHGYFVTLRVTAPTEEQAMMTAHEARLARGMAIADLDECSPTSDAPIPRSLVW